MDGKIVVPEEMLKAAEKAWIDNASQGSIKALKNAVEAALRWQIENWGTAPNSQRMPDIWYAKSKEKWDTFKSQWGSEHQIPFVDLLIFFITRYHESFLAHEPEHKDGTVVYREGTTIPIGVWSGGKMYTTNVPDPKLPCQCSRCDSGYIYSEPLSTSAYMNEPGHCACGQKDDEHYSQCGCRSAQCRNKGSK